MTPETVGATYRVAPSLRALGLDGSGYTITFIAGDSGGSATYNFVGTTGILYPKFKIASIIYDSPGKYSTNGFTDTLTDGTSTSTGSNFGVGVTDTFSVTGGFLGSGDTLSWSAGVSTTRWKHHCGYGHDRTGYGRAERIEPQRSQCHKPSAGLVHYLAQSGSLLYLDGSGLGNLQHGHAISNSRRP